MTLLEATTKELKALHEKTGQCHQWNQLSQSILNQASAQLAVGDRAAAYVTNSVEKGVEVSAGLIRATNAFASEREYWWWAAGRLADSQTATSAIMSPDYRCRKLHAQLIRRMAQAIQGDVGHNNDLTLFFELRSSPDREYRRRLFTTLMSGYSQVQQSMAALVSIVSSDHILALDTDPANGPVGVSVPVAERFVEFCRNNATLMHNYVEMRAERLGVKRVEGWDLGVSLGGSSEEIDMGLALELLKSTLDGFPVRFLDVFKQALAESWFNIRQEESRGQFRGGFTRNVYGVHPYVSLSWANDIEHTFALAHEFGHAVHFTLANEHQPYWSAKPDQLSAEVAAAVMEWSLWRAHKGTDMGTKLVWGALRFLQQTFNFGMLTNLELNILSRSRQGQKVSSKWLTDAWADICKEYYGPKFNVTHGVGLGWCRQQSLLEQYPFHSAAYGLARSVALHMTGEQDVSLVEFMGSGGSVPGWSAIREHTGVNLEHATSFERLFDGFYDLVARLSR